MLDFVFVLTEMKVQLFYLQCLKICRLSLRGKGVFYEKVVGS